MAGKRCMDRLGAEFKSYQEAQDFVLSANLHRRHLTPGARASHSGFCAQMEARGQAERNSII